MQPPYWLMSKNMALSPQFRLSTKGKKVKKDNSNDPYNPFGINPLLIIPTVMTTFSRIWYGKSMHQMEKDERFQEIVTQ